MTGNIDFTADYSKLMDNKRTYEKQEEMVVDPAVAEKLLKDTKIKYNAFHKSLEKLYDYRQKKEFYDALISADSIAEKLN